MTDICESRLATLEAHLETLEAKLERKDERIATLESRVDEYERRLNAHDERIDDQSEQLETETNRLEAIAEATRKRTGANKTRIEELQSRELEKGAHLQTETVDEHELEVQGGQLERITKDDGQTYFRLPNSADPLDGGSECVSLAHGDLLPIQQLARMDDDMLQSTTNALPTRLAAHLWKARTDPSVGDSPWKTGCKGIKASIKASDLKHWIRRHEPGTSETYAKKLVSRTIDAMLDLSKHRVAVRKRTERKNGLEYTERRLIIPADAEIPGTPSDSSETDDDSPETADVLG